MGRSFNNTKTIYAVPKCRLAEAPDAPEDDEPETEVEKQVSNYSHITDLCRKWKSQTREIEF